MNAEGNRRSPAAMALRRGLKRRAIVGDLLAWQRSRHVLPVDAITKLFPVLQVMVAKLLTAP